jgi:2-hydroxychromene-2-carboxylate isomerase
LALAPTLALAAETDTTINWQPFSSRSFKIPAEKPDEAVGDRHRRVRAIAQRETHLHYAKAQGLAMHFGETMHGANVALAALAAIVTDTDNDPLPFIKAAFSAYWVEQKDLDDPAIVQELLAAAGLTVAEVECTQESLDLLRDTALEQGIFETPTYVIDEQRFLGREHLPWLRTLIKDHQA